MVRRATFIALLLQVVLPAIPQQRPPEAASEPVILKSASRAVQLHVFVSDSSGRPVRRLQKSDFVVTDNGHPRDIRIFAGELDANQTVQSPGVYSNRRAMRDSRFVTAIVLDAVPRPEGSQRNGGRFASATSAFWLNSVRSQAMRAIDRIEPGQTIAIYAACPDLRIVQDYTSDSARLLASLRAFVPPRLPDAAAKNKSPTIDTLVPPMLSVLRDVAGRMSAASGRKSVVWISQAYGAELDLSAIRGATESTVAAFNDANVLLYAVDARFSPTCEAPNFPAGPPSAGVIDRSYTVTLTCSQARDVSDGWMDDLASATGGRAFSGGNVIGVEGRDAGTGERWGMYQSQRNDGVVGEALRFALDDARYAYELGFYVPESELDGKVHTLAVTVPAKPKFVLRYRTKYTASFDGNGPPAAQELDRP
jgi:VWFA-related protein